MVGPGDGRLFSLGFSLMPNRLGRLPDVAPGDVVAFHQGWVASRLSPRQPPRPTSS
jgi:hypothetical protein